MELQFRGNGERIAPGSVVPGEWERSRGIHFAGSVPRDLSASRQEVSVSKVTEWSASQFQEVLFQMIEVAKEPRNPFCRFSSKGLVSPSRQEVLFQMVEWQRSRGIHFAGVQFQGIGECITPGRVVPGD